MDQEDLRAVIAMLQDWKLGAENDANTMSETAYLIDNAARTNGEAIGLGLAINALEHFVEE